MDSSALARGNANPGTDFGKSWKSSCVPAWLTERHATRDTRCILTARPPRLDCPETTVSSEWNNRFFMVTQQIKLRALFEQWERNETQERESGRTTALLDSGDHMP